MHKLTDIINFNHITVFQHYSSIIFVISTVVQTFYAILIIKCTNKHMKFFRTIMLIYIFFCFLAELLFVCWKPIRLLPFSIFYPVGIASPMSSQISGIFFVLFATCIMMLIDCLILIMVERHFEIASITSPKFIVPKTAVYISTFLINFCGILSFILAFLMNNNDDDVYKELIENVENVTDLLNHQPSLISIKLSFNINSIFVGVMIIFEWHRLALVFWLLYENYHYNKNCTLNLSEKTKKQLNLMFKTAVSQFLVFLTFALPLGVWILSVFLPLNDSFLHISYLGLLGFTILYPIVDVIVVVIVVSPYRKAVKAMFQTSFATKIGSNHTSYTVY